MNDYMPFIIIVSYSQTNCC